jgi:peptidoglycan/xylan/chitin deacetylase (PgdA/CDA1 family)
MKFLIRKVSPKFLLISHSERRILIIGVLIGFLLIVPIYGAKRNIVISFDDGYYSLYYYGYPILKKHHVPITLGIITSYLDYSTVPRTFANKYNFMNIGEIKEMKRTLNIEIASHSISHRDLTTLSDSEIKYELKMSKRVLDSIFLEPTITFIYPYGNFNSKIINFVKEASFLLARSTLYGEPNFWVGRYKLPIKEVRKETTVEEVISHIKNHDTTILLFHRLSPHPKVFTEWDVKKFSTLIETLASDSSVNFLTLKGLYYEWCNEKLLNLIRNTKWGICQFLFQNVDIDQTRTMNSRLFE